MNIQDPTILAISILSLSLLALLVIQIYQSIQVKKLRGEVNRYETECANNYKSGQSLHSQFTSSTTKNIIGLESRISLIEKYLHKPLYNVGEVVEWDEEFGTISKGEIVSILERDPYQGINVVYNVQVFTESHPVKVYKHINERDITAWY